MIVSSSMATSPGCRIEMVRHRDRFLQAAPFHAATWEAPCSDGETIRRDVLRVAGRVE